MARCTGGCCRWSRWVRHSDSRTPEGGRQACGERFAQPRCARDTVVTDDGQSVPIREFLFAPPNRWLAGRHRPLIEAPSGFSGPDVGAQE